MTGINDGKFEIKKGQGISQAIAEEIGLTKEQCKKVDWKSVFEIVNEAKGKEGNNVNWDGGSDSFIPANQKYIVHTGDKIEFSQEMWKKITDVVKNSLVTKDINKKNIPQGLQIKVQGQYSEKINKEIEAATKLLLKAAKMNPKPKIKRYQAYNDANGVRHESVAMQISQYEYIDLDKMDNGEVFVQFSTKANDDDSEYGSSAELGFVINKNKNNQMQVWHYFDPNESEGGKGINVNGKEHVDALKTIIKEIFGNEIEW